MQRGYESSYNRIFKHWIDFLLALVLVIILLPIFVIIGITIVLDDGFPVFYHPLRGGYRNKSFHIVKFRSMVKNADKIGGGTTALYDTRITRIGNVLRKTKIDEIPQLFNILEGTMSFVGPRPELIQYINQYAGEEKLILEVRPGITDFSSLEYINLDEIVGAQNVDEYYEQHILKNKNKLRIKYAHEVSFATDAMLFFQTVWHVFKKAMKYFRKN